MIIKKMAIDAYLIVSVIYDKSIKSYRMIYKIIKKGRTDYFI
jgi:hypothetical protein